MNAPWTTLPNANRVLQHADDARPAWLWSQDGKRLIWSNAASVLFEAKIKKRGLRLLDPAVPIKGQVNRIIRLGSPGRTSLARIQFAAGDKPISATCAATPLAWDNDETALLIVAVDPVSAEIMAAYRDELGEDGDAPVDVPVIDEPDLASLPVIPDEQSDDELPEAPQGEIAADQAYARELRSWQEGDAEAAYDEPLPVDDEVVTGPTTEEIEAELAAWSETGDSLPQDAEAAEQAPAADDATVQQMPPSVSRLSALVDRLGADENLYTPLNANDDITPGFDVPAVEPEDMAPAPLFRVTGRGFVPDVDVEQKPDADPVSQMIANLAEMDEKPPEDAETVERVSRYNFDELSRILNDRVGNAPAPRTPAPANASTGGSLVNLGGETLVLNRLPLGILVFRDQEIVFANRAITEMIGYETVEGLRNAGLGAVFPAMGDDGQEAGPVNHLVQRDGTLVPVTARLQSISWQGRPALMLSASSTEVRTGHEEAVRAFAQSFAELNGTGYFEANRAGMVVNANGVAGNLLGGGKSLTGKLLTTLVDPEDLLALRGFFERPARFAETARPAIVLRSADGRGEINLFAQGQAGIVSGYFAFVQGPGASPARISGPAPELDPALLARIGRGVRRPLNTIIGFADLLRSEGFSTLGSERYDDYAQDIASAGQEIAALVSELEDYARLREGRYLPQRASLDLTELLESCVLRIRNQANGKRVLVRNAISETLPRVTADKASLTQAVLNLLASAIDQSPSGGAVVISAQRHDDGGIAIHVRDSSAHSVDMAERFVVFRDGVNRDGQALTPVRSSLGLALTRSLLAVNAVSLSVDPAGEKGLLFSLKIPADLIDMARERPSLQ